MLDDPEGANHNLASVLISKAVFVPFFEFVDLQLAVLVECSGLLEQDSTDVVLQEAPELICLLHFVKVVADLTLAPNRRLPERHSVSLGDQDNRDGQDKL